MSLLDLIPTAYRGWAVALVLLVVAGLGAGAAWTAQAWRYDAKLAQQSLAVSQDAEQRAKDVLAYLNAAEAKRKTLQARLDLNDRTHFKELANAQKDHKLLASRLATAELRLSVILASSTAEPGGGGVQAAASSTGVVHAAARAELDPAHAQRIVGITDDGDDGLIALAACQGWARAVWESSGGGGP